MLSIFENCPRSRSTTADDSAGTELAPLTTSRSLLRGRIERWNAAHISTSVCEIDIVSPRFDARARHDVVLSLKRASRVNDDARFEPPQLRGEIRGANVEHCGFCGRADRIRHCPCLLRISARDHNAVIPIGGQRCDDESAEVSVTAENDCRAHAATQRRKRSAMSAVGTTHASRRPNNR